MKTAIFYYSQSGQAKEIAQSLAKSMGEVVVKEIRPTMTFPYPWSRRDFFDAFPESRLGLPPCKIEELGLRNCQDSGVIVMVCQSWFLSPSLPLQAFMEDPEVRAFMKGRKVVLVNGCRNMWLMTMHKVRNSLGDMGAEMVGHIVMQDRNPNLVSVMTIICWLFYGKKQRSWLLPSAGVSPTDIDRGEHFGKIIAKAIADDDYANLQRRLVEAGAIDYKPSVLFLEKIGHRMFGLWARFIRKKGNFGDSRRQFRCTLFIIYLVVVLYLISPFGVLFFWLTYPLRNISRQKDNDCIKFGMK